MAVMHLICRAVIRWMGQQVLRHGRFRQACRHCMALITVPISMFPPAVHPLGNSTCELSDSKGSGQGWDAGIAMQLAFPAAMAAGTAGPPSHQPDPTHEASSATAPAPGSLNAAEEAKKKSSKRAPSFLAAPGPR